MRQLILDLLPDLAPTINNFVAGHSLEALDALTAWLKQEQQGNSSDLEKVFFLWGEIGSGKTHLLQAAVNAYGGRYFDAAVDPALQALQADCGEAVFRRKPELIAVDAVNQLDESGQAGLFRYFNHIKMSGSELSGRLLVADCNPPLQLQAALREDLRTRLGSALIYRLWPLSDADKLAALAAQAEARALKLPEGALAYLLEHAPRDMRSLSGFIHALDRYSLTHKRPVTLPLLREVMRQPSVDGKL